MRVIEEHRDSPDTTPVGRLVLVVSGNNPCSSLIGTVAGTFGACPVTNSGGVTADLFSARYRGLAMSLFAIAPFMGPALGRTASKLVQSYVADIFCRRSDNQRLPVHFKSRLAI